MVPAICIANHFNIEQVKYCFSDASSIQMLVIQILNVYVFLLTGATNTHCRDARMRAAVKKRSKEYC